MPQRCFFLLLELAAVLGAPTMALQPEGALVTAASTCTPDKTCMQFKASGTTEETQELMCNEFGTQAMFRSCCQEAVCDRFRDKLPLWKVKFLMAHDAATGYIVPGITKWNFDTVKWEDLIQWDALKKIGFDDLAAVKWDAIAQAYLKTQDLDIVGQLDCGVRALDLRIGKENDTSPVSLHHGPIFVSNTDIKDVGPTWLKWAADNPTELVILTLGECQIGTAYTDCAQFYPAFTDLGLKVITDKAQANGLTFGQAKKLGKLKGGGMMLAFAEGAVLDGHWPGEDCNTVTLYGQNPLPMIAEALFSIVIKFSQAVGISKWLQNMTKADVSKEGETSAFGQTLKCPLEQQQPRLKYLGCDESCWTHMDQYMNQYMNQTTLTGVQLFWQETAAQIVSFGALPATSLTTNGGLGNMVLGSLSKAYYSIRGVSYQSGVNQHVLELARSGALSNANFIIMNTNNVYGPLIAEALDAAHIPPNTCPMSLYSAKQCLSNMDCGQSSWSLFGNACARPAAKTDLMVCCPSKKSVQAKNLLWYCTDMPTGSLCINDEMCKSKKCVGAGSFSDFDVALGIKSAKCA